MVDYIISLFTKPEITWSVVDHLAIAGMIVAVLMVICLIWWLVWTIVDAIKARHK